ncbi:hypothetical protein H8356DRAFT_1358239 [Neocallimastix lanati (nom. inval.)]|nr:hypothetical protein H8356DRAFT_1358239 [Neocallimastix sp. JGI-2020a]
MRYCPNCGPERMAIWVHFMCPCQYNILLMIMYLNGLSYIGLACQSVNAENSLKLSRRDDICLYESAEIKDVFNYGDTNNISAENRYSITNLNSINSDSILLFMEIEVTRANLQFISNSDETSIFTDR